MWIASFFRRRHPPAAVAEAYRRIVEQARVPRFYTEWSVPDTLDGRFEMLALHAFLVLRRLKREGDAAAAFAQSLFDFMFADLDRSLREMGASDLGVGRQVKAMAQGFYGRILSYEHGLQDEAALAEALRRNLYGTIDAPEAAAVAAMSRYLHRQVQVLERVKLASLLAGLVAFAE
ncbi:MAG TPA: ubiquinol-cytochrome C chaperone family protein [Stellaceae bacterium]|nr:ubiquinol-cytochrome C chaperone family protein [Stellaceae bacterium]